MIVWMLCLLLQASPPPAENDTAAELAKVHRVYVDLLSGNESAFKLRDLLITSLQNSKVFIITEDRDKADAVLKGTGSDSAYVEKFDSSDNLSARSTLTLPVGNNNTTSRNSKSTGAGLSVGENESRRTEERKHEAIATVRLVGKDGDVLWSTTQESPGGKFLGAAADVADKVAKKLAADVRLARQATAK
jgi:hypothetical protein